MIKFKCNYCDKEVKEKNAWYKQSEKHYCSQSCYWKDKRGKWLTKICKNCGIKYEVAVYTLKQSPHEFCCNSCWRTWQKTHKKTRKEIWQKYNQKFQTKLSKRKWHEYKNFGGMETLKGDKICVMCGNNKDLVIHHIDGNHNNNVLSNLVILCRSCHSRTHGIMRGGINKKGVVYL